MLTDIGINVLSQNSSSSKDGKIFVIMIIANSDSDNKVVRMDITL